MFEEMTLDATRPTHLLGAVYGGNEVVVHLHHSHSSLSSHTVEYALLCVCVFGALKVNGSTVWFGVHVMLYSYPSPGCVTVIRNPLFFDLHCSGGRSFACCQFSVFFVLYLSFCCSGATSHCWLSHSTHRKGHTHTHTQPRMTCVRIVVVVTTAMCGCCFRSASTSSGIPCWEGWQRYTWGVLPQETNQSALLGFDANLGAQKKIGRERQERVCRIDKNELNCTLAKHFSISLFVGVYGVWRRTLWSTSSPLTHCYSIISVLLHLLTISDCHPLIPVSDCRGKQLDSNCHCHHA